MGNDSWTNDPKGGTKDRALCFFFCSALFTMFFFCFGPMSTWFMIPCWPSERQCLFPFSPFLFSSSFLFCPLLAGSGRVHHHLHSTIQAVDLYLHSWRECGLRPGWPQCFGLGPGWQRTQLRRQLGRQGSRTFLDAPFVDVFVFPVFLGAPFAAAALSIFRGGLGTRAAQAIFSEASFLTCKRCFFNGGQHPHMQGPTGQAGGTHPGHPGRPPTSH